MQTIQFSRARAHLAETLHVVEIAQEPIVISRRGKAAAVLMSMPEYRRLADTPATFSARLAQWRANWGELAVGADPFTGIRESDGGREFSW